jgi:hypothetical protein
MKKQNSRVETSSTGFWGTMQRSWVGSWLIVVALIHTIFAFVVFGDGFNLIVDKGIFNSIGTDPYLAAVAWFLIAGIYILGIGMAIFEIEKISGAIPLKITALLFISLVIGITLMPQSGFWLALPAVVGAFMRRNNFKRME